jgi:hypothetical protein
MKILRVLLSGSLILLGIITSNAILPARTAEAQLLGRVKARMSRSTGLWEIVNSTNVTAVVRYAVTTRGTSEWRNHKAFVPPSSTRMLGYDIKTYDLKIVQVDKQGY